MKKLFFLTALFFLFSHVFAQGASMAGQKNIRYVSTEYFDIIFSDESQESAGRLYYSADSICRSLCADLGIAPPAAKIPVVISSATDEYNAYYTNYNFNHIVIYDASPSEDFMVFSDPLLGVFEHELTHFLTLNIKNGFWSGVGSVFGDLFNWGDYVLLTPLIKEGAAVASESRAGEGRLNDGFYLHASRQAKLSGKYFSYADVSGARDIYPYLNLSYSFGGPFTQYLQQKYGMEPYVQFFYNAVNAKAFTYEGAFKKAYGLSLNSAWKDFYNSISVPDIFLDPLQNDFISDFFADKKDDALYDSLTASETGFCYIDRATASVWFCTDEGRMAKLFFKDGLDRISFSLDAQYLSLDYYSQNFPALKRKTEVYCFKNDSFILCPLDGVLGSCVVKTGGRDVLFCLQKNSVTLCTLQKTAEPYASVSLPEDMTAFSPCALNDGRVAFLCREGKDFYIMLFSPEDFSFCKVLIPMQTCSAQSLSYAGESEDGVMLVFSWAKEDTFPRLATVSLNGEDASFTFMDEDVSGGVYSASCIQKNKFAYAADFVTERKIFVMDFSKVKTKTLSSTVSYILSDLSGNQKSVSEDFLLSAKKWRHPYYKKGTLLPLTAISVPDAFSDERAAIVFPCATWITNNAWDSRSLLVSLGINPGGGFLYPLQPEDFMAALDVRTFGGTSTQLFSYDASSQVVFGSGGFLQSSVKLNMQSVLWTQGSFSFLAHNDAFAFASLNEYSLKDELSLQLSCIRQCGRGYYERGGFSLFARGGFYLNNEFSFYAYPALVLMMPHILPLSCAKDFTYNLPLKVQLLFYPRPDVPLDVQIDTVLFSWNVQKGIPYVPVFINRITLAAGYEALLYSSKTGDRVNDVLHAELVIDPTPNSGAMVHLAGYFTFGLSFKYYPHLRDQKNWTLSFTSSIAL